MISRLKTLVATLLSALVLGACASQTAAPTAPDKPKLVVLIVVDGLPQRQVTAYRDQLAPDGLARFLDRGTWYADAHYSHAYTVTGAGHATVLTGANPSRSGIIGNEWRDPATGEPVYCTGDTSANYIGHATRALDGTSPKNLKVPTVGDVLRGVDARSKVIAVSGKDRGAILPAGHKGTAYMYMGSTGQFASSTYYMKEHPAWVNAFNAAKPADRFFKSHWTALLPPTAYARSLPDGQTWFGPAGGALPMRYGSDQDDAPGAQYYGSLLRGPFQDQLTLEFARAAIVAEQLGRDDAPDILAVSLSGHDYVNHAYSAESRLSHDHTLQLDRMLQSFFKDLDTMVGKDSYVAVLTADHGFMPAPEYSASLGLSAGRLNSSQMLARLNQGLQAQFGEGRWVRGFSGATLLFDTSLLASSKVDASALAEAARALLMAEPAMGAAYTRAELQSGSRAGAPFFEAMRNAWHPDVSGDVQYALKPNWLFSSGTSGTTHGSPHAYDTHVPILLYGPKWFKPGRVDTRVAVVDIAPSLSRLLGIAAPAGSQGKPLPSAVP
ncbi:alkaline phosphatase family protein [Rhodoferax sp.]|uniref:alkaline phosphatase family protein n=1 Tax=Rhodoferax sp. TaxID=50421 RepID=UPI002772110C|nr:alkaline phosphatase family protein [Rhodoferax sp.]